jgi:KaiC/GvpD/RAD55 family RecA-like ATPase
MIEERPDSTALIIEDVVTATLLTNLGALIRHGTTFKEEMMLRKSNWQFISKACELNSALRFDTLVLLQVLEDEGEMKNPRKEYEKLIRSLKGDHDFDRVYTSWLDAARQRYMKSKDAEMPLVVGPHNFNQVSAHRIHVVYEASHLGGMNISTPIDQAAAAFMADIYERRAGGGANLLTTGFPRVDEEVILDPGQTIVLAARPGVGKTSLAIEFLMRSESVGPALMNSLEMDFNQLLRKMLESKSIMPGYMIKKPWVMEEEHLARLEEGVAKLKQANIHFCRHFDLLQLEAAIIQYRPMVVVVDYIQMYSQPSTWRGSRAEFITMVSKELARMSRDHKTIFLVLSQVNRQGVDDPGSHNMKDAGGIEENADSVWILHRVDAAAEDRSSLKYLLKVTKNRSGPSFFDQELLFDGETQRFVVWNDDEAEKLWQRKLAHQRRRDQGQGEGGSSHAIP